MMNQRILIAKKQNLNWQAIIIEEAQTELKLLIKNAILDKDGNQTYQTLRKQILEVINRAVKELESPDLKRTSAFALLRFAEKLYSDSLVAMGVPISSLLLVYGYLKSGADLQTVIQQQRALIKPSIGEAVQEIAQPTQKYSKEYFKQVKPALEKIIKSEPMYDTRVSLRNIAEMTVRYEDTIKKIDTLINNGVNLVMSSRHANCSKRCEPWQGKYYTLDNTYQVVDGIEFQPLSNATDQFYTTKAGKTYKNGHITGYNCRHYLIPYKKGYTQPEVSAEVIARERAIDQKMRSMEREVRKWKDAALIYKGEDKDLYETAKMKALIYNSKYIQFAKSNNRAYYPSRTDIF